MFFPNPYFILMPQVPIYTKKNIFYIINGLQLQEKIMEYQTGMFYRFLDDAKMLDS